MPQSQLKRCRYVIYASFLELEFFVVQVDSKGTSIHVFQLKELSLHPNFSISIFFLFFFLSVTVHRIQFMHHSPRLLSTRLKLGKNFCIKSLQSLQLCAHNFSGDCLCIITLEHAKLSLCLTEH